MNFATKHIDKLNFIGLLSNKNLPNEFLDKYSDKFYIALPEKSWFYYWGCLSKRPDIFTVEFLYKNHTMESIINLIEKYPDFISWEYVSQLKYLTKDFVDDYFFQLDLYALSCHCNLEIILAYDWGLPIEGLMINPNIKPDYFKNNYKDNNYALECYFSNKNVTMEFLEEFLEEIDWNDIVFNSYLPLEFIEKYSDRIDWRFIWHNKNITIEFIEKYIKKVNWDVLSENKCLTLEFIEKHMDKLDWHGICKNSCITIEFVEKYIDKIDWYSLSMNPIIFGHNEHSVKKLKKYSVHYKKFVTLLEELLDFPPEIVDLVLIY